MLKYIISTNNYDEVKINQKVDEFSQKVFSFIKVIDESVVIVDFHNEMKQGGLNYDWILSQYGDYSGYEASCNEMRISDYLDINNIQPAPFILKLFENLKSILKKKCPQFNFVFIGIIKTDEIEIRFHSLRNNEKGWLSEDIDEYNEAIVIVTV
jgi:hypothetical protein